jgi:hypothetical protein
MFDDSQTPLGSSRAVANAGWLLAILAFMISIVIVGAVILRADDERPPASSGTLPQGETTTTTISSKAEVTSRLREILRIRDEALRTRNADLLKEIYTVDCPCLEDGRALITQLRKQRIVWKGVATRIAVRSSEEVDSRLWIVIATLRTPSVRIETETGRLVRVVPPEENIVRFALARPHNDDDWLLGHASNLQ